MSHTPNTQKASTAPTVEAPQNTSSSAQESTIRNANAQPREVPDVSGAQSVGEAMLAYAEAGFYVLPVDPTRDGGKNPGSLLGSNWPTQSTTDPGLIKVWAKAWPNANIAIHTGRSGVTVFDVDNPDELGGILATALYSGVGTAYQSTRTDNPARGHYLFANPEGRVFGNSRGTLGSEWGDVRGSNGVIIVQPSKHNLPEGTYTWRNHTIQPMPPELADALVDRPVATSFTETPTPPLNQPAHIFGEGRGMNEKIGDSGRDALGKIRRHRQTFGVAANCIEMGYTDAEALWVLSQHEPTMDKFGARGDLVAEVGRNIAYHRPLHPHEGQTCGQAQCPNKPDWMDEEAPKVDVTLIEPDVRVGDSGLPKEFEDAAQLGRQTPYPIDALPPVIADFAQEVADKVEVGVDMVAPHVLGNVSVATMGRLSGFCGYETPTVLWTMVLAPPSAKKSPVEKAASRTLGHLQMEYQEKSYERVANYELDLEEASKINEEIKKSGKIGGNKGRDVTREEKLEWRVRYQKLHDNPVTRPRFTMSGNTSPEALMRNAHSQQGRVAIVTSEGSQLRTAVGLKYGKTGDADFVPLISGWDVTSPYDASRMKEESDFIVERPSIPVNIFAQEDLMQAIFTHPDARGGGFLPRLLLWSAEPRPDLITDDPVEQPAGPAVEAYDRFIARLVHNLRDLEEPLLVEMEDEARNIMGRVVGACERAAFQQDRTALDTHFLGKTGQHIPRIALLLHTARVGIEAVKDGARITAKDVEGAVRIVAAHYGHYLDILNAGAVDQMLPTVRLLMERVWAVAEGEGKDVKLTKSKLTTGSRIWRKYASESTEVLVAALNKADELGLITADEAFGTRIKFTVHHDALKNFMAQVA